MPTSIRRCRAIINSVWDSLSPEAMMEFNRNLVRIEFHSWSDEYQSSLRNWCDENLKGLYMLVDDEHMVFEFESDMVAFKAKWHGDSGTGDELL